MICRKNLKCHICIAFHLVKGLVHVDTGDSISVTLVLDDLSSMAYQFLLLANTFVAPSID